MSQRGFVPIYLLIGAVILVALSGALYFGKLPLNPATSQPQVTVTPTPRPQISITPTPQQLRLDKSSGLVTYASSKNSFSVQFPKQWVVKKEKDRIYFTSRERTSKEIEEDVPGLPVDIASGSVMVINTERVVNFVRWKDYSKITEEKFFNIQNWSKGDQGGGGPGTTHLVPEEVSIGGKRVMKQVTHPTRVYEWWAPIHLTVRYYIWLGNEGNEVLLIDLTYDDTNPQKDVLLEDFDKILATFKFN